MIKADQTLDCKGMSCPMPIVRTKKAMEQLQPGQVLEMLATDKGSLADIQGWARNTGHQYIGTVQEAELLRHYLRKSSLDEAKDARKYPYVVSNEQLLQKLAGAEKITLLDVREPAEYVFNRIPDAYSIPLGELEERWSELKPEDEILVVCRTGTRSDLACQLLADKGFKQVFNVEPGMSEWNGPVEKNNNWGEGLNLIHREAHRQLPLPAGREAMAERFRETDMPSIPQLVEMAKELGVKFIACQMTMDVMGLDREQFIEGIEVGGAVTFLDFAKDANVSLSF